jgi:hypothetical protein
MMFVNKARRRAGAIRSPDLWIYEVQNFRQVLAVRPQRTFVGAALLGGFGTKDHGLQPVGVNRSHPGVPVRAK